MELMSELGSHGGPRCLGQRAVSERFIFFHSLQDLSWGLRQALRDHLGRDRLRQHSGAVSLAGLVSKMELVQDSG